MRKAFTLIELMISISLGAVLLLTSFYVLSNYTKLFSKSSQKAERLQIAGRVLDRICEDILSADKIGETSSATNLILFYPSYNLSYDYQNGKVRRRQNSSSNYLTDDKEVASLSFGYKDKLVTIKVDNYETKTYCRN